MPRLVKRETKIRWHDLFEKGMSVPEIRKQQRAPTDPRTIERAIDEISAEKLKSRARELALQEGLREHWRQLLAALDTLPGEGFDWKDASSEPVMALGSGASSGDGWSARLGSGYWLVSLDFDGMLQAKLLGEHLGSDRFFKLLDSFRDALRDAVSTRMALAKQLVDALRKTTGKELVRGGRRDGLVSVGLSALFAVLEQRILGDGNPGVEVRFEEGGLWTGDRLLLAGEPGAAQDLAPRIEPVLDELARLDLRADLIASDNKVQRLARELQEEREILKLSTVLPGECRVCSRITR